MMKSRRICLLAVAAVSILSFALPVAARTPAPFPEFSRPRAITHGPHDHLFASYYGVNPWNADNRYVLALETDVNGRLPLPGEKATLGVVDMKDGDRFIPIAETACWNFQEGTMAHWLPNEKDTLVYNDLRDGKFVAVVVNFKTGAERVYPWPISAVSPDGTKAISINYARMRLTRPDYGYAGGGQDAREGVTFPADDGLFLVDLRTGEAKLIVSIASVKGSVPSVKSFPDKPGAPLSYFCHTVFSKDGSRVFWLSRSVDWYDKKTATHPMWHTTAFTCDADGGHVRRCFPDGWGASHFNWKDDKTMVVTVLYKNSLWSHVEFTVGEEEKVRRLAPGLLDWDGHCLYTPDGRFMASDSDQHVSRKKLGERFVSLTRLEDGAVKSIGAFSFPEKYAGEYWRCDLHGRFRPDGGQFGFNSVHEGSRQLYVMDVARQEPERNSETGGSSAGYGKRLIDRCWMWGHETGQVDGKHAKLFGLDVATNYFHMVDGAKSFGLENLNVIRWDKPDKRFRDSLRGMKRLTWPISGAAGETHTTYAELGDWTFATAREMDNVTGFELDDYFVPTNETPTFARTPTGIEPVCPTRFPYDDLVALKRRMESFGRPLELRLVVYDDLFKERKDPQDLKPVIDVVDSVTYWVWKAENIVRLDESFALYRSLAPDKPTYLGIYLWDFGGAKPMPVELLKRQLDMGVNWFRQGKIEGFVFLCSSICNRRLPAVEYARMWLRQHADESRAHETGSASVKPLRSLDVQALVEKAGAGETVCIPAGAWEAKPFSLKSDMTLYLEEGAFIYASTNRIDYAEGCGRRGFVSAEGVTNLAVTGRGVIFGRGHVFKEKTGLKAESQPQALPVMMRFTRCSNLRLEGFTYRDCGAWGCHLQNCDGVTMRGVKCFSHVNNTNDGIDIESSNVLVEDCDIDSDDDAIVFKTESDKTFPVTNVVIRNCRMASCCSALKFGTGSYCDFRDIRIENCHFDRPKGNFRFNWKETLADRGVREDLTGLSGMSLEVVDGGRMENVTVRDIDLEGYIVPIFIRLQRRHEAPEGHASYLRNVLIENVRGACATSRNGCSITGVPGLRPSGIAIRNVSLSFPGGGTESERSTDVPELEKDYPEGIMFGRNLPAWAFYLRHVDNVRFENVVFSLVADDARERIVQDDCTGVVIK